MYLSALGEIMVDMTQMADICVRVQLPWGQRSPVCLDYSIITMPVHSLRDWLYIAELTVVYIVMWLRIFQRPYLMEHPPITYSSSLTFLYLFKIKKKEELRHYMGYGLLHRDQYFGVRCNRYRWWEERIWPYESGNLCSNSKSPTTWADKLLQIQSLILMSFVHS